MKITNRHLRKLRYIAPVFCSMAVLSTQLHAGPTVQLNGDEMRDGMADSGSLGYVGGNTRVGVSINRDLEGQIDLNQIIMEDDSSATSAEGWFGYKLKDDDTRTQGILGGGVKLNHQWVNDDKDTVHKVFGAYDQDVDDRGKATVGYGQETEDLFWSGHVSKSISDDVVNGDITTRSYDYGVGAQVGTFLESSLTRIRGGLDYEFGTEFADNEDRPGKATLSAGIEQFFHDSPHSISLDVSGNQVSGGNDAENTDFNARVGYRYEFGGDGVYRSAGGTSRRRVEIPGSPGRPGRAGVPAIPPTPAIAAIPAQPGRAAIPAQPGRAAVPPRYERRAVATPGHEFVKTTMKLENETFFKINSSKLTQSAKRNLDKIVSQIRGHGYLGAIRITGNTCGLGDPAYDQRLSENRANSVRSYLLDKGFNPEHLIARGLGKGSPKYDRKDDDFRNRRVDLEYVTERTVKKAANKTQYRDVLVQEGRPAIAPRPGRPATPARPGRPGRAGHPGRAAIPAIPATPGTPSRFVWKTEVVPSAPIWIQRAIRNTISHNKTISTYTTRNAGKTVDDQFTATGSNTTMDVLANDSEGLTLIRVTQPTGGTVTIVNGRVVYVANPGFTGTDTFTYTVEDADGNEITSRVTVDVPVMVNNAPMAVDDNASTDEATAVLIDVIGNDSDSDGDTLTIGNMTNPSNGTVQLINGQIQYTPNAGFSGTDTFTYTITDGNNNQSTATVNVTVSDTNQAPVAVNDASTTPEDTPVTINVISNDSDPDGDNLSVITLGQASNGTVAIVNNQVVYTPNAGFSGNDTFTYVINDGNGNSSTASVNVTVTDKNSAPIAVNDAETTPLNTPVTISVLTNDSDVDGDTLSIVNATNPSNGSVSVVGTTIVYTPDNGYTGQDTFNYTITDNQGNNVTAMVTVTVASANVPPIAVDDTASTPLNTPVTIGVTGNDSDPDGSSVCVTNATNPANGSVSISSNGTDVIYTPNAGFTGVDTFVYTVCDADGGTDTATVTVTVGSGNQAPKLTDDSITTPFDTAVTMNVTGNDTDPENDSLTITATTNPANGTASITGNNVTYTPTPGYVGVDSYTYTVSDGNGNTATANATVIISGSTLGLNAVNDTATTGYQTPVTINVSGNDTNPDGGNTCVTSITSNPSDGFVTISSTGQDVVYTPNNGFVGTDSFVYLACDSEGDTAPATVTVNVTASNQAPVLSPNYAAIQGYLPVTIRVLADDIDPDGDNLTIVRTHTGPNNGTVTISGDDVIYQPTNGFVGADSFYYEVSDGNGNLVSERVDIDVQGSSNNAPVVATIPDLNASATGTTSTDIGSYLTDADGDTVYVAVADALSGTITFNGTVLQYTPNAGEVVAGGTDTIYITVSDGQGGVASEIIMVNIQ